MSDDMRVDRWRLFFITRLKNIWDIQFGMGRRALKEIAPYQNGKSFHRHLLLSARGKNGKVLEQ